MKWTDPGRSHRSKTWWPHRDDYHKVRVERRIPEINFTNLQECMRLTETLSKEEGRSQDVTVTSPHTQIPSPWQGWGFSSAQLRLLHIAGAHWTSLSGLSNKASLLISPPTPTIIWKTFLALRILRNKGYCFFLPQKKRKIPSWQSIFV